MSCCCEMWGPDGLMAKGCGCGAMETETIIAKGQEPLEHPYNVVFNRGPALTKRSGFVAIPKLGDIKRNEYHCIKCNAVWHQAAACPICRLEAPPTRTMHSIPYQEITTSKKLTYAEVQERLGNSPWYHLFVEQDD